MKTCSKCGFPKELSEFNWAKRAKDERKSACRACTKSDAKVYSAKPEVKARNAAYHVEYVQRSGVHQRTTENMAAWHMKNKPRRNAEASARYVQSVNSGSLSPLLYRLRTRAKGLGIPFNLDNADLQIPEVCPVLGLKLAGFYTGQKGPRPDSISIDRIIPALGYVKGNVRVMSHRANTLLNNASIEELEKVVAFLRAYQATAAD